MAPLMQPAVPVRFDAEVEGLAGNKIRIVGTMIGHDASRDLLLLADRDLAIAILVDISVVVNSTRHLPFLRGGKATLMVSGYLETCEDEIELPSILNWAWEPATIFRHVILQATLITDASKLDLHAWNKAIEEREQIGLGFSVSSGP